MSRTAVLTHFLVCLLISCALAAPVHARQSVLFDQGHGQLFTIEKTGDLDISHLAVLFRDAGFAVTSAAGPLGADLLAGVDALVLSGAFKPYTPEEIEAIAAFVARGGALCIMLHIGPPVSELLNRLGVDHSNGVIREQRDMIDHDPRNFRVTRLANHPLFRGLRQFSLYGAWALHENHPGVQALAVSSPSAWIDLNRNERLDPSDPQQSFAVTVAGTSGRGRFVVFGDDAIFQNKFLVGDNLVLGLNLVKWLSRNSVPAPSREERTPARNIHGGPAVEAAEYRSLLPRQVGDVDTLQKTLKVS